MPKKWLALLLTALLIAGLVPAHADGFSDMMEKAEAFLAQGDADRAIACCQLAQRLDPENQAPFLLEARARLEKDDTDGAQAILGGLLAKDPLCSEAWLLQCRADALLSDLDAFEEHSLFAEVCGADLSSVAASAAYLYEQAGNAEKAQAWQALAGEVAGPEALSEPSAQRSALDEAFDSGELILQQAEFPAITAADFDIPDAFWALNGQEAPKNPSAVIEARLAELNLYWLSLSPTGDSGLIAANGMLSVSWYGGKYHILYPSARGVPDENGNLARFMQTPLSHLLGSEGFVYSPNGRYAAVLNVQSTVVNARFEYDPVVIDLQTGEVILTATYPNKIMQPGAGAVTTACFSADSQSLYYMTYQTGNDFMTCLYRCDLETLETQLCGSFSDYTYWPGLFETADGDIICLRDGKKQMDVAGIVRMHQADGVWHYDNRSYALPMKYWNANRLLYSAKSNFAVVLARPGSLSREAFAFLCVNLSEDYEGIRRHVVIANDGTLLCLDGKALSESVDAWAADPEAGAPYQAILTARLSPDGQYLILLTQKSAEEGKAEARTLYLVRLSDLAIREVSGLETDRIRTQSDLFPPVFEWNDGLIVECDDGIQRYAFH